MLYGYRFDGKFSPEEGHYYDSSNILLDPYAKAIISRDEFGVLGPDDNCWPQMACMVPTREEEFDWEGDMHLKLPQKILLYMKCMCEVLQGMSLVKLNSLAHTRVLQRSLTI